MKIDFTKMHGCGNDYVYVDGSKYNLDKGEKSKLAVSLSDRHFGIGSDGLIFINKSSLADFEMEMYNADGSRAEMCGNGIRCVAKYVYDRKMIDKTEFSIESMGKIKIINVTTEDDKVTEVSVDMGEPILEPALIPVTSYEKNDKDFIDEPVNVNGEIIKMTCVSMGNPHAVMFIEERPIDFDLNYYGSKFEGNTDVFPKKINAEFAKVIDRNNIEMRVYERGTGETLACGTGTCATVVAGILNGYVDNDVTVHLLGGDLQIQWSGNEDDSVFMTGPATYVFSGEI